MTMDSREKPSIPLTTIGTRFEYLGRRWEVIGFTLGGKIKFKALDGNLRSEMDFAVFEREAKCKNC